MGMGASKGKHAWTAKAGEEGRFAIPPKARGKFGAHPGGIQIFFAGEEKGTAILRNAQVGALAERAIGKSNAPAKIQPAKGGPNAA